MSTEISEVDGGPLPTKNSVFEYYEEGLRNNADGPAVIVMFQPAEHLSELVAETTRASQEDELNGGQHEVEPKGSDFLSWTYREIHLASLRFANALLKAGIQSDKSRVMCLIPNGIEYPLLLWTSTLARLTLCSLDFGALHPTRNLELQNFFETLSPDVVVVPDAIGTEAVDTILFKQSLSQPKVKLIVSATLSDDHVKSGWQTLSDFILSGPYPLLKDDDTLRREAKLVSPHHVGSILFTSGTSSGKPKGCLKTVQQMCHILQAQSWITPGGKNSRTLIAGANFRIMSQSFTAQTWYAGGAVVMPYNVFSPEVALQAIQKHRVDSLVMVPYHFHAIIDHPKFHSTDVSSLRLLACGGDMVTKDLLIKLETAFPKVEQLRPGHGMTEGGGLFSWPYERGLADLPYFGGIAPLGKIDVGARMRIVDKDTGRIMKRGEPGEIHVSSLGFSTDYLGGVKKEDWYDDDSGKWFMTGDLGMIAEDGSIYILGRIKDIIKRAGVPITPAALENCIEGHTKCPSSVIAIPHPTLGAEPYAVVENFDHANEVQIKQSVIDEFGPDYSLGGAVSLAQLGLRQFPLNATSKIMKIELQKPVEEYLQSRTD